MPDMRHQFAEGLGDVMNKFGLTAWILAAVLITAGNGQEEALEKPNGVISTLARVELSLTPEVKREYPPYVNDSTYRTSESAETVSNRYKAALAAAALGFGGGYDGFGISLRAADSDYSCVIKITEVKDRVTVHTLCDTTKQPPPPPVVFTPQRNPLGSRHVEYSISGTADGARITMRNNVGGTEQHRVDVPFHYSFDASPGMFVYISAQKAGSDGEIHVAIRVDGATLQDAYASSPYGIATASGAVPK
jgi:hypothetical protein